MLSLVDYETSNSENESGDEGGEQHNQHHLSWNLPPPSVKKLEVAEENDEFSMKRAIPTAVLPKKNKVKIMIPRLSDLRSDDLEDEKEIAKRIPTAAKKSGLLSLLPKPTSCIPPTSKPHSLKTIEAQPKIDRMIQPNVLAAKKVGLVPYVLMSHNKSVEKAQAQKRDDSDDEDISGGYFTFDSKIDELPKVSDDEVRALLAEESKRLELRKRHCDESTMNSSDIPSGQAELQQQKDLQNFDADAIKALMGGNKAKRSRVEDIQIIDLSASEVLPNRDEWLRKTLAGETSYIATGNIVEKVNAETRN